MALGSGLKELLLCSVYEKKKNYERKRDRKKEEACDMLFTAAASHRLKSSPWSRAMHTASDTHTHYAIYGTVYFLFYHSKCSLAFEYPNRNSNKLWLYQQLHISFVKM